MTKRWLAGVAMTLVLGCSDTSGPSPLEALYNANLQKWTQSGPKSYQMEIGRSCACPPSGTVILTVRNLVVESRVYSDTGEPVPPEKADEFPDVPTLFAIIRQALDLDYYRLSIQYDATYGYPATVLLDRVGSTLEDNINYQILDLQPLTGP